jgi:SOS-response transcriptional repressor LexA
MRTFRDIVDLVKSRKNLKTDEEVGKLLGLAKQSLSDRIGRDSVPYKSLSVLARQESWDLNELLYETPLPIPQGLEVKMYPVIGRCPAGFPENIAEEVIEYVPQVGLPQGSVVVVVKGDSMKGLFDHGDYIAFLPGANVRDGDVAVVANEFGDCMVKRYRLKGEEVYLTSENPAYPPVKANDHYRLLGKVVAAWRKLQVY